MSDNPRPDHLGPIHYRVRAGGSLHATIRIRAQGNAAVLGRLAEGESWHGTPVVGQSIYVTRMGSSNVWVRSEDHRFVSMIALEEVQEES